MESSVCDHIEISNFLHYNMHFSDTHNPFSNTVKLGRNFVYLYAYDTVHCNAPAFIVPYLLIKANYYIASYSTM